MTCELEQCLDSNGTTTAQLTNITLVKAKDMLRWLSLELLLFVDGLVSFRNN